MDVKKVWVTVGERRMRVATIGPADAPTLLLVHGFPLDHKMWSWQLRSDSPLAKRFRILCPDLLGCGSSDNIGKSTSIEQMADELAAMLEQLANEPVIFCGLSMGGYIGWKFCARHMEKVSHFIGCHTRSASDSAETQRARRVISESVMSSGPQSLAHSMTEKLFSQSNNGQQRSEAFSLVFNTIASTSADTIVKLQTAMAQRDDMTDFLPEMYVPTLLIGGSDDTITPPEEMEMIASKLPKGKFVSFDGVGHLSPLEAPQMFNEQIIDFAG